LRILDGSDRGDGGVCRGARVGEHETGSECGERCWRLGSIFRTFSARGWWPNFQGLTDAQLTNKVKALVFKVGGLGSADWVVRARRGPFRRTRWMVLIEALKGFGGYVDDDRRW